MTVVCPRPGPQTAVWLLCDAQIIPYFPAGLQGECRDPPLTRSKQGDSADSITTSPQPGPGLAILDTGFLAMPGSLPLAGFHESFGSLSRLGFLMCRGSLAVRGFLAAIGSLGPFGSLRFNGSLT